MPSLRQLAKGQYASTAALSSYHHQQVPPSPPPPLPSFVNGENDTFPFKSNLLPIAHTTNDNASNNNGQQQRKLIESKFTHSYNTILVTATLTTLHSKLINDCDQLLASTILPPSKQKSKQKFPEDSLRAIMNDLRKMSDMVEWEDGEGPVSKSSVAAFFQVLDQQISQGQGFVDAAEASSTSQKQKDKKQQQQQIPQTNTANQALATAVKDIVSKQI